MSKDYQTAEKQSEANINGANKAREVRLIGNEAEQLGVLSLREALAKAESVGLDLVEVSPHTKPPVCKLMDYGKFRYQKTRKQKKQKKQETKEIKFRPSIDDNDFNVKLRSIEKFILKGSKVRCTVQFKGREMSHRSLGAKILQRVKDVMKGKSKLDQDISSVDRNMSMTLSP